MSIKAFVGLCVTYGGYCGHRDIVLVTLQRCDQYKARSRTQRNITEVLIAFRIAGYFPVMVVQQGGTVSSESQHLELEAPVSLANEK